MAAKLRLWFLKILFPALLSLAGCAHLVAEDVRESIRAAPDAGSFIEGVPFFPQQRQMCGPSALASVLNFYGLRLGQEEIAAEVFEPKLGGTLAMDMLIYAKEAGFDAEYYNGGLDDLKVELGRGRPLILFLNLGHDFFPFGHYVVALGYSDPLKAVIVHSGREMEKVLGYGELIRAWEKTGFATLLITPRGQR